MMLYRAIPSKMYVIIFSIEIVLINGVYAGIVNSRKPVYVILISAQIIGIEFGNIIMAASSCNNFDEFIGSAEKIVSAWLRRR